MRALALVGFVVTAAFVVLAIEVRRSPDAAVATQLVKLDEPTEEHLPEPDVPMSASDALLARLRTSGVASDGWATQGLEVLVGVGGDGAEVRDAACYVAGCGAVFVFADTGVYQARIGQLTASDAFRAWSGGTQLTDPETRPDGRVVVALALYRPD